MILNYATQDQVNEINSNLSDYDLSNTSLESTTTFKQMIQKLIEKNFPLSPSDVRYIVNNGVINEPFDNTVYLYHSEMQSSSQWAYQSNYQALGHSIIATSNTTQSSAGYSTSNTIDLTDYTKLTVVGRTLQTSEWETKEFDISNISGSKYLVIDAHRKMGTSSRMAVTIYISTAKQYFYTNKVLECECFLTSDTTTSNYVQVKDIYLE